MEAMSAQRGEWKRWVMSTQRAAGRVAHGAWQKIKKSQKFVQKEGVHDGT
jgi:hypothetical protein